MKDAFIQSETEEQKVLMVSRHISDEAREWYTALGYTLLVDKDMPRGDLAFNPSTLQVDPLQVRRLLMVEARKPPRTNQTESAPDAIQTFDVPVDLLRATLELAGDRASIVRVYDYGTFFDWSVLDKGDE